MKTPTLSKRSFGSGLQCHKRLWIEGVTELVGPTPTAHQAILDQAVVRGGLSRLAPKILFSGVDRESLVVIYSYYP